MIMNSLKRNFFVGRKSFQRNYDSGFTLVELMITVAILSILAAVAIPAYSNYMNRAKQSDAIIGLKAAQMAEEQYYSENGAYCDTNINLLPGFSDADTTDKVYKKGEYTLKMVSNLSSATTFVIEAVWADTKKGIDDRWTISNTNNDPVLDTSKSGIKGYSVFGWIFD